jgi:hypothetical protein
MGCCLILILSIEWRTLLLDAKRITNEVNNAIKHNLHHLFVYIISWTAEQFATLVEVPSTMNNVTGPLAKASRDPLLQA